MAFDSERALIGFLRDAARVKSEQRAAAAVSVACTAPVAVTVDSTATGQGPAVVRGRVRRHVPPGGDADGIAGASLAIEPLGLAVVSTTDGTFQLPVPAESLSTARTVTVRVRSVGYGAQRQSLTLRRGDRVDLDVPLCPAMMHLAQAAVTGVAASESVTNTQHDGVDEGGIVKRHGDHLVILRRGRLFTVDVGRGRLRPVAAVDAFGPDIDPRHAWYDELLVAGDRAVVIGYSYERGGTELGVFQLSPTGGIRHLGTYHLRSNDYYSSENYASRLIGTRLVVYTPLTFHGDTANPLAALPAMRRWRAGADSTSAVSFRPTATARRVFRPAGEVDPASLETLHTVTSCDLAAPELACESTVVLGGDARVFHVSPTAVYVSAAAWRQPAPRPDSMRPPRVPQRSVLYRLPLDGRPPAALHTAGSPIDQFSFLERDGHLNVVLREHGGGDGMWRAERPVAALALLRLPLTRFSDGTTAAPGSAYRSLPAPDAGLPLQNRFVGDHLLYGAGNAWWHPRAVQPTLFVVPASGGDVARLRMSHGVDRIEALGRDAVVVGSDTANLHFTAVRLGESPALAHRYMLPQASQGELRSHGFFYRPDAGAKGAGTLGLPVARPGRPGFEHLFEESASVLFLRNERGAFRRLGELAARPERTEDDGCRASCMDWYGNARPLFLDGRVFALLGYEVVEGRMRGGRIVEVRRASFAPQARRAAGGA